jgi:hypothetical protein
MLDDSRADRHRQDAHVRAGDYLRRAVHDDAAPPIGDTLSATHRRQGGEGMPFRSKETLERWLEEFHAQRGAGDLIRVAVQDGTGGADTGLVVVPLEHATVSVFMEPVDIGEAQWRITIEPQPDTTILSSHQLHAMAVELQVAAELCAFLEARSIGHEESLAES